MMLGVFLSRNLATNFATEVHRKNAIRKHPATSKANTSGRKIDLGIGPLAINKPWGHLPTATTTKEKIFPSAPASTRTL